ncbi:DUF2516 family protein [Nocardia alni]|uniref:DUF2516 family protein n=1 Tax=Nocardia alni TaxID=2815723 RepID=UPI001C23840B|nr:DUF2516 family protein [Nocardia alni]
MLLVELAALGACLFALVHAIRQRRDAFTAVDKLTKPIWVTILAVATLILILPFVAGFSLGMIGLIASVVATGVYLADVRPKVDEIQRGPRW